MGAIGKVFSFAGKVLGTVVVGGIGTVAGIMETGAPSGDMAKSCGGIKDGCYNVVKKMWDDDATTDDVVSSLSDSKDALFEFRDTVEMFKMEQVKEALNNPQKMKELLKQAGKNPALADNPKFMKAMREKYL